MNESPDLVQVIQDLVNLLGEDELNQLNSLYASRLSEHHDHPHEVSDDLFRTRATNDAFQQAQLSAPGFDEILLTLQSFVEEQRRLKERTAHASLAGQQAPFDEAIRQNPSCLQPLIQYLNREFIMAGKVVFNRYTIICVAAFLLVELGIAPEKIRNFIDLKPSVPDLIEMITKSDRTSPK